MYTDRFRAFMPFILKWECVHDRAGNVIAEHDPDDPGGLTKYGIDKASHPGVDVASLTLAQAMEIYWKEWAKEGSEPLPEKLGEAFFNACVNCGSSRAWKIKVDPNYPHTAGGFIEGQEAFYRRLVAQRPALSKFLRGWLNRTADLRRFLGVA